MTGFDPIQHATDNPTPTSKFMRFGQNHPNIQCVLSRENAAFEEKHWVNGVPHDCTMRETGECRHCEDGDKPKASYVYDAMIFPERQVTRLSMSKWAFENSVLKVVKELNEKGGKSVYDHRIMLTMTGAGKAAKYSATVVEEVTEAPF